jgi:hypothetical protein
VIDTGLPVLLDLIHDRVDVAPGDERIDRTIAPGLARPAGERRVDLLSEPSHWRGDRLGVVRRAEPARIAK